MKPNFALTLSFEGIGLLHRTYAGWHLVGEVKLDVADLAADLAALAAKARALDPTGLRSKVVLPAEQIKYLALETADREVGAIDGQVRAALDGATPYALKELSYDWSVRDSTVFVAAVARETLAEAESFATEHGFNPLCFVAMPEDDQFAGEPFFGETVHAGKVLGADESIDRENQVIRIVGTARMPEPQPVPETDVVFDAEPEPVAAPESDRAPEPDPAPKPAPAPGPANGADSARKDRRKKRQDKRAAKPAPEKEPAAAPVAFTSIRHAKGGDGAKAGASAARAPELPKARFSPPPMATGTAAPAEPAGTPEKKPPVSRAAPRATEATLSGNEAERLGASLRPMEEDGEADPAPPSERAEGPSRASFFSRRKRLGGMSGAAARKKARAGAGTAAPPKPDAAAPAMATASPAAATAAMDEKSRMTVFGARRMESDAGSDRPRYLALVLTAILLLVLVAIAAWAALFLDDGISGLFRRAEETRIAEEAPETDSPAALAQTPADTGVETGEAENVIEAALPAEAPEAEAEELADLPEPVEEDETGLPERLPEVIPEELTPDEARARYAATGIWQMAPEPSVAPGTTVMQDVYQTNLDPDVDFSDAVALPEAEALRPETRPETPADPPPPSAEYDLDARGFIAATPEGTETPEGVTIFAGRPPIEPPPTPPRAEPRALDGPEAAAPDEPTLRPRLRPDDVTDAFERTSLGGRTRAELATLRPRLRPKSDQQIAEEALAAETGTAAAEPGDALATATEEAVAASLKPQPRPRNFAQRVERIREASAAQPVAADQRVVPDIPSSASVARAATEKNRISLRRVNLIGVYGKENSRRALVRLANGRYRKVQVGDRLDGGQVAAIGEDELRYVKGGRPVVLKMPQG